MRSGTPGDPVAHLEALRAAAAACEAAGVGLLVLDGRRPPSGPWHPLEAFTVLGALVPATSTLRLAGLVAADERSPALAAKAAATLDVCSSGRAALAFAPPAAPDLEAVAAELVGECVEVATAMLREPGATVEGCHVAVRHAWNEPRWAGSPPPVGVLGERRPGDLPGRGGLWRVPPSFVLREREPSTSPVAPGAEAPGRAPAPVTVAAVRLADAAEATPRLLRELAEACEAVS